MLKTLKNRAELSQNYSDIDRRVKGDLNPISPGNLASPILHNEPEKENSTIQTTAATRESCNKRKKQPGIVKNINLSKVEWLPSTTKLANSKQLEFVDMELLPLSKQVGGVGGLERRNSTSLAESMIGLAYLDIVQPKKCLTASQADLSDFGPRTISYHDLRVTKPELVNKMQCIHSVNMTSMAKIMTKI